MNRLVSLDFFRGLTVALMIMVNDPGSWSHVYAPLLHADWHGLTPTDLVFPFFLFIVGVSIALSYNKQRQSGNVNASTYRKIISRSIKIFLLGLLLWLFPKFDFAGLRYAGVLQRIAIVFLACAILYLNSDWKKQLYWGIFCLVGYYLAMAFVPFPGGTAGTLEPGVNLAAYVDSLLLPGRMWQGTWDPEGFLSTIPAIGTGITGLLAGAIILNKKLTNHQKVIWLFFAGFVSFLLGHVWSWFFPINKPIWTSSYVLVTSGLAAMFLAASMWIIDELGYRKGTKVGVVFGMNAITAYVLHGLIAKIFGMKIIAGKSVMATWMGAWTDIGMSPKFASLLYALAYTAFIYIWVYWLYRKKIFIKI